MTHSSNQNCIDACYACAVACDHCAQACLQEAHVEKMRECILNDIHCAAVCRLAAQLMAGRSAHVAEMCALCAKVCEDCYRECSKHEDDHCRACAEACRRCAEECRKMAA